MMDIMTAMRDALMGARSRTGDKTLATSVSKGKFRVERITFNDAGVSRVLPVTDYDTLDNTITALNSL